MTTAPFLPETDLAWIAPLTPDQKRKALTSFKMGRPPYSYRPVRASYGDLLSLDTPLLGGLGDVPFERIAQVIARNSKHDKEADANIRVAAGLYAQRWRGRRQPLRSAGTSIGQSLTYWTPVVLAVDDRPVIPFFNPRREPLSVDGRRFVFSMMHEHIRLADPDYAAVVFCICHFAATKVGPRPARPTYDTGVLPYGLDELEAMIADTYAIWAEVWAGRVDEMRRRDGSTGGLF